MARDTERMRALIPVLQELNRHSTEKDLRAAEDAICVATGDAHFRMTNSTLHHTHHYLRSLDAAVGLLGRRASWLCAVLDHVNGSARLVNGAGLPVAGKDHLSHADTMPLALCTAILRALVDQDERQAAYDLRQRLSTGSIVT